MSETHTADGATGVDPVGPALADIITRIRRALRARVRDEFPWEKLPMAQVEIMQSLTDEPGMRVGVLATKRRMATNTVSNLIQQMVVAGLVERVPDAKDRRAVALTLTEHGQATLQAWLAANERVIMDAFRGLGEFERSALVMAIPALLSLSFALERD